MDFLCFSKFFRVGSVENWSFKPGDSFALVLGSQKIKGIGFVKIVFRFWARQGQLGLVAGFLGRK